MNEDLKFYEDGDFDIEILDVEQKGDTIRVKTRCPYGEDNFGISSKSLYLDTDGIPKWKKQVKKLLFSKYGKRLEDKTSTTAPKKIMKEHIGKMKLNDLDKK